MVGWTLIKVSAVSCFVGVLSGCREEKASSTSATDQHAVAPMKADEQPAADRKPEPKATAPLKREWHGIALGSSPDDIPAAAKAMGYSYLHEGHTNCHPEPKGRITLYDYVEHGYAVQTGIPLTECYLTSPAGAEADSKTKKLPQTGVRHVTLKYVNNKLYELDIKFLAHPSFGWLVG